MSTIQFYCRYHYQLLLNFGPYMFCKLLHILGLNLYMSIYELVVILVSIGMSCIPISYPYLGGLLYHGWRHHRKVGLVALAPAYVPM